MKLDSIHVDKIDELLRQALISATGSEVFRAVVLLDAPQTTEWLGRAAENSTTRPDHFESPMEYRKALVQAREEQLASCTEETLERLRDLSLTPISGGLSRSIVVEGSALQLKKALELPGVKHASLDRPVEIAGRNRDGIEPGQDN